MHAVLSTIDSIKKRCLHVVYWPLCGFMSCIGFLTEADAVSNLGAGYWQKTIHLCRQLALSAGGEGEEGSKGVIERVEGVEKGRETVRQRKRKGEKRLVNFLFFSNALRKIPAYVTHTQKQIKSFKVAASSLKPEIRFPTK